MEYVFAVDKRLYFCLELLFVLKEVTTTVDLQVVGQRIKMAREAKNLSQEDLASMVDLSPTHISVIERGVKTTKLDTFVAIANALEVSADALLVDVVEHSVLGVTNELYDMISGISKKDQKRVLNAVRAFIMED